MTTDLLHDEISTVETVRELWIRRYFAPTDANIKAHEEALKACKIPPMTAIFPEAVIERERLEK